MIVEVKLKLQSEKLKAGHNFEQLVIKSVQNRVDTDVRILSSEYTIIAAPKTEAQIREALAEIKKSRTTAEGFVAAPYGNKVSVLEWVLGLREEL